MVKIRLQDIFIGSYPVSQRFGENPATYSWIKDINGNPIKGHNGVDFGYGGKNGIELLNPFPAGNEVIVSFVGFDQAGYGWYLRIWDKTQQVVVLYGHGQEIKVAQGQTLFEQQLVALGDNTGWSTGPHLHLALYRVDAVGNKLNRTNGYDGFIDAMGSEVEWIIKNPTKPAVAPTTGADSDPLAVCLADRKMWWDRYNTINTEYETFKTQKATEIKQLTEANAKTAEDLVKADTTAQTLRTQIAGKNKIIEQKDIEIKQIPEIVKQTVSRVIAGALESKEAELAPYIYYNLTPGELIKNGLLKLLGSDIKPKPQEGGENDNGN